MIKTKRCCSICGQKFDDKYGESGSINHDNYTNQDEMYNRDQVYLTTYSYDEEGNITSSETHLVDKGSVMGSRDVDFIQLQSVNYEIKVGCEF